jgi:hypothetical protein
MSIKDSAEEAKENFKELQKLAQILRKDLSEFNLGDTVKDAATVKEMLKGWNNEIRDSLDSLDSISASFQNTVSEISKGNVGLNQTKKSFNKLTSLAEALTDHTRGYNKLSVKQLESITTQAQQEKKRLETTLNTLKAEKDHLTQQGATQSKLDQINAAISEAEAIVKNTGEKSNAAYRDLLINAQALAEKQGKVNDAMGLGGTALDGMVSAMDSLGMKGLTEKLGLDEAKKKMEEMADELTNGGTTAATMGQKFKIMGAGLKSMGSSLGKNLTDPAFLIAQMGEALKIADDGAGDMAKKMNLTYGEALNTRRELGNMAASSGDVALNTKNLQESYMAVGAALGTNAMLNEKDLTTMTKLVTQAGFQHSELMEIQKLSLSQNKSLEDNTKEILGGAKAYASRKGTIVNEKEVLKEVNLMSASLKLSLGGSATKMAEAVVQAKMFGLTLEQAEKISSSLLQFESSIESELSAELLTGKELNFEKARQLALEGKTAEAAAEVAKQVGSSKDFTKMNVIQQEALAAAAGMTKDELAQSLIDKEAMAKMNDQEGATAKEKFNNLVKEVGMEKAKAQLGDEALANQMEQQSVQERFALATEKLKEIFIQIAEPVLAILSPLMDLVGIVLPAINFLLQPLIAGFQIIADTIGFISQGISMFAGWLGEGSAAATALKVVLAPIAAIVGVIAAGLIYASLSAIPVVGPFLAPIAVLGMLAMLAKAAMGSSSSSKKGNDIMSSGYGKRTLFGPEGAIQLNNKDTVIAGTDLFSKGDDVISPSPNELSKPQEITSPTNNITNNYTQNQKQEKDTLKVSNKTSPSPKPPDTNTQLLAEMKKQNYLREQSNRQNKTVSTLRIQ